jgi:histidinol-phosphate phosphatase family protein
MNERKDVAVFLDRDGTINVDTGFVSSPEKVELIAKVGEAIRKLNEEDIPVFIITNQSGVGRGLYNQEDVEDVNMEVKRQLHAQGTSVQDTDYCPHAPWDNCECRKPKPEMIRRAKEKWALNFGRIYTIGDKPSDIELAHNEGGKGILVLTGQTKTTEEIESWSVQPDFVARDLLVAVEWILEDIKKGP